MRYFPLSLVLAFLLATPATAAECGLGADFDNPKGAAECMLLTVTLKADQSKTFEEIGKHLDASGFWKKFPPAGIEIESWWVLPGLEHVITLRLPPSRLREVNLSIEKTVWGAFRVEIYPTYDYREIARQRREKALQAQ